MKTKTIFAVAALALCLAACKKKDVSCETLDMHLVGTWQWQYTVVSRPIEYGHHITPEEAGKNETLSFSQDLKWTYLINGVMNGNGTMKVITKTSPVDLVDYDYIVFTDVKNDSVFELHYRIENDTLYTKDDPYTVGVGYKVWSREL